MKEQEQITKALEDGFMQILGRMQGPPRNRLWSFEDIANYLCVSTREARDKITKRPDFPAKLRISGGCQRWQPEKVIKWAETYEVKKY